MELNRDVARKVLETVDQGLSHGLGIPTPGRMCVEAAVCYALGLPHGDDPRCVAPVVRSFKISLNDRNWSSPAARAKGLRRVAIAQLGSEHIDQQLFVSEVAIGVIKQLVPIALRAAGSMIPRSKDELEAAAAACEAVVDLSTAHSAAEAAREVARSARSYYALNAASYAADAAGAGIRAASYAADADAYHALNYAADAAAYSSSAASYAADAYEVDESKSEMDRAQARDSGLSQTAEIAVQALIKCGAKGCEWLDLCD